MNRALSRLFLSICCLVAAGLPAGSSAGAAPPVAIESRFAGGRWSRATAVHPLDGQSIELRVRPIDGAQVYWYRIVPDIHTLYHNAEWPWAERGAYRWLGFERIRYQRVELEQYRGRWTIVLDTRAGEAASRRPASAVPAGQAAPYAVSGGAGPLVAGADYSRSDLGSFWYQVEVHHRGTVRRSAGLEAVTGRGLPPSVFRVSIREGEGLIGWLTSYYNVPAIFGSTPWQSWNYVGVDCADVLMAGWHRFRGRPLTRDYNVETLARTLPKVATTQIEGGSPRTPLRWGREVRPGDFIAVRYEGAKFYQHIGALYRDENRDGLLDAGDLVLHAGPEPLHTSALSEGGFDGTVVILRPK